MAPRVAVGAATVAEAVAVAEAAALTAPLATMAMPAILPRATEGLAEAGAVAEAVAVSAAGGETTTGTMALAAGERCQLPRSRDLDSIRMEPCLTISPNPVRLSSVIPSF